MSRRCEICGKGPTSGRTYSRRGLAKKKGGVGKKITGKTNRTFRPNLQKVKVREVGGAIRSKKICASCLRTGLKKGTVVKVVGGSRASYTKAAPEETAPVPETTS